MEPIAVLEGLVVEGEQRGRTLGFPTANVTPDPGQAIPAHGVYAAKAVRTTTGEEWDAAVSIGLRPTFDTALGELDEAHLLDFTGDLYGERIRLALLAQLRGELRFDSADELVAAIERDIEQVRQHTLQARLGDGETPGAGSA